MPGAVNAVIHELTGRAFSAIHELSAAVDRMWRTGCDATGQPPIANISIRGRLDVAPERISE